MKIMVVDDCQTTRKLLVLYLKTNGFNTAVAENGLDALEQLAAGDINLILSDLNMPYMDGIELVKAIRSDPNWSYIPIIMVTTEADPEEKERALKAGVNGFIVKPVTADVITQNIKSIMKEIFTGQGGDNA